MSQITIEPTQQDTQIENPTLVEDQGDRLVHKERFTHFIASKYLAQTTTSSAISVKTGKLFADMISDSPDLEQLTKPSLAKLKAKIKTRNLCLMLNESNERVLAQNLEKRQRNKAGKLISMIPPVYVIKEVALIENFYEILLNIHNNMVSHSGENKTEYQIDLRYACFPTAVIDEYCKLCPVCSLKKIQTVQSTIIPIESFKFWERIQIDLIDMRYKAETLNGKF